MRLSLGRLVNAMTALIGIMHDAADTMAG